MAEDLTPATAETAPESRNLEGSVSIAPAQEQPASSEIQTSAPTVGDNIAAAESGVSSSNTPSEGTSPQVMPPARRVVPTSEVIEDISRADFWNRVLGNAIHS